MSNYRRYYYPGGSYFFTLNLLERKRTLLIDAYEQLCDSVQKVKQRYPFRLDTYAVLPDHLHVIIRLPEGDSDYSTRIRLIKTGFSKQLPKSERITKIREKRQERGIWQRRYWEHLIRDDNDFQRHVDYIHYNPVKHGYVKQVKDWPYSSFRTYVKRGCYTLDWGGVNIEHKITAGE